MEITSASDALKDQRELVAKTEEAGWEMVVGDAVVRGLRDIGYKSTSYAIAELIDNAAEAAAQHVDIIFGFESGDKPNRIAVVDDGYGMEPKMVRASLVLGAGTRNDKRKGFGKYGYGLKTASVSQCKRVTVYSKTADGSWHSCFIDIDDIKKGGWGSRLQVPPEKPDQVPPFVVEYLKAQGRWDSFASGTVVVWEHLDRVQYIQRAKLRDHLLTDLGVIYRNVLNATPMTVDGVKIQPCDPLFLTAGFRGYDIDDDRAIALEPATVAVKDKATGQEIGYLRLRFARMPATFYRKPEFKHDYKAGSNAMNERHKIAQANNGIVFTRHGRQIDVKRPPRNFGSINVTTDLYWGIEVDFDATLDEMLAITTSKQQVTPEDGIWDILRDKANVFTNISDMRSAYKKEAAAIAAKADADKEQKRASIAAIEAAEKFRTTKAPNDSPKRQEEAEANLDQEARRRAEKAGVEPAVIKREIVAQQEGKTRDVQTEDLPGGPFYRCAQVGGQRVLFLNVSHPFYGELYAGPDATPRLRAGLEILLWALGEAEVEADPGTDKRTFYEMERTMVWSPRVATALAELKKLPLAEAQSDVAEAEAADASAA